MTLAELELPTAEAVRMGTPHADEQSDRARGAGDPAARVIPDR
ncbi:hypothetical protein ACIRCZ_02635 [Leifsonia sp. NPDC102414]